jgi:hypothetical protein
MVARVGLGDVLEHRGHTCRALGVTSSPGQCGLNQSSACANVSGISAVFGCRDRLVAVTTHPPPVRLRA